MSKGMKIFSSCYPSRCLKPNRCETFITWLSHTLDQYSVQSTRMNTSFGTKFVLSIASICYFGFKRNQSSNFIRTADDRIEVLLVLPAYPPLLWWNYNRICVDPLLSETNTYFDNCFSTVRVASRSISGSKDYSIDNSQEDKNTEARGNNHFHRRRRPPPVFGASLQLLLNDTHPVTPSSSDDELNLLPGNSREDCPICIKYSQGPCGEKFRQWLACTDKYTDQIDSKTGEDLHLSKCEQFAQGLADCLQKHQDFYSSSPSFEQHPLKEAWQTLIQDLEEESKHRYEEFPNCLCPEVHIHPKKKYGLVQFLEQKHPKKSLIVAFVKDQDSDLLAAAMKEDMVEEEDDVKILLRMDLPTDLKFVTIYAIYEDDDTVIYTKVMHVPPALLSL